MQHLVGHLVIGEFQSEGECARRTFAHHLSDSFPTVSAWAVRYACMWGPMCGFLVPLEARRGATGWMGTCSASAMAMGMGRDEIGRRQEGRRTLYSDAIPVTRPRA